MYAVIMAGGQGTRLWPLSRQKKPKQLHAFASEKPLILETYERLLPKFKPDKIIISTTPDFVEDIKRILPDIPAENYIVEPVQNGNVAACGLVTQILNLRDRTATAIFLPSDHLISENKKFLEILDYAERLIKAHPDHVLTIGINPTRPDTGLGYIQLDSQIDRSDGLKAFSVKRFVEKPSNEKAEEYVASWEYLWNSGIFVWKTETMLDLYQKNLPQAHKILATIGAAWESGQGEIVLKKEYPKIENTSIDYGIMEKTKKLIVIPGDFGWSDIGSWGTLLQVLSDLHKTKIITKGHHVGIGDENCLVIAGDKLIATVGLENIVIVDSPDALLVCNSERSQEVKDLLNKLKSEGKHLYL